MLLYWELDIGNEQSNAPKSLHKALLSVIVTHSSQQTLGLLNSTIASKETNKHDHWTDTNQDVDTWTDRHTDSRILWQFMLS